MARQRTKWNKTTKFRVAMEAERDELYRKVGQQQVQINFLKKKLGVDQLPNFGKIEPDHEHLSVRRIDEIHTAHITWGSRKIRDALRLGLRVVFPQGAHRRLPAVHEVYPYLLRGLAITRVNQVWSVDPTYIRLADGLVYLTAIIDWYSRKILAWDLSLTMNKSSAIEVLCMQPVLSQPFPEFISDKTAGFKKERQLLNELPAIQPLSTIVNLQRTIVHSSFPTVHRSGR